jgi:hypothetical protein
VPVSLRQIYTLPSARPSSLAGVYTLKEARTFAPTQHEILVHTTKTAPNDVFSHLLARELTHQTMLEHVP